MFGHPSLGLFYRSTKDQPFFGIRGQTNKKEGGCRGSEEISDLFDVLFQLLQLIKFEPPIFSWRIRLYQILKFICL